MARNGIDAIILVSSVGNPFTEEEQSAIRNFQSLFGAKIIGYMIVVFTDGDRLGDHLTLDDYLGHGAVLALLKEVLERCENRMVLFDNQTKDEVNRIQQVNQLMKLVDNVVQKNNGLPYTNYLFIEMQKQAAIMRDKQLMLNSLTSKSAANLELIHLKEEMNKKSEEQLKLITETFGVKLNEGTAELKKQVEAEQAVRCMAEEALKSSDEICKLRKDIGKAQTLASEIEELRKQLTAKGSCSMHIIL